MENKVVNFVVLISWIVKEEGNEKKIVSLIG